MKIRDVMTLDIEVVTPDDTLKAAVHLMADFDCERFESLRTTI